MRQRKWPSRGNLHSGFIMSWIDSVGCCTMTHVHRKMREIEGCDILQQFDDSVHGMGNQLLAPLCRCCRGITRHALVVQVRHLPAEGMRAIGAQMLEALGEVGLARAEALPPSPYPPCPDEAPASPTSRYRRRGCRSPCPPA